MSARRPVRFPALGAAMRRARRVRPGLSGSALARALGWTQVKVSMIETGRQEPTVDEVTAWAEATGADVRALLAERDQALDRYLDVRTAARLPGGVEAMQVSVTEIERGSTTIVEYQPTVLPGLVQTPDYTRAWLTQPDRLSLAGDLDVELIVARRAERQRRFAERALTVAVPPWVLGAVYGTGQAGRDVQAEQLDRLESMARGGGCELIVTTAPVALLHGFELLDDAVLIETAAGVSVLGDPELLARFRRALARMRATGATGTFALAALAAARRGLHRAPSER